MTDPTLDDLPSRTLTWCLRAVCAVALCVCAYLAWTALRQSDVLGCGDGQIWDCGHVLHSHWSKWLGIPVSIPAFLMYTTMMFALSVSGSRSNPSVVRFSWGIVTVFGLAAGIAAIWFISLQAFVIRSLCVYCLGVHTCGIIMSVLILGSRPLGKKMTSALSSLSIVTACVLVAGQMLSPHAETYAEERYDTLETSDVDSVFGLEVEESDSVEFLAPAGELFDAPAAESADDKDRLSRSPIPIVDDVRIFVNSAQAPVPSYSPLPGEENEATVGQEKPTSTPSPSPAEPPEKKLVDVLGGRAQLNARNWPLIGDSDADFILVELFDYTCPHCRKMNEQIRSARERYNNRLAIVTLPVPLDRECNDAIASTKARHRHACEIARLAIAVWRVDPDAFQSYHEWLFQPAHGRTAAEARSHAAQLVGNARLNEELAKPIVGQFIAKHVELYKRSRKGTVPKLMFPKVTITGQMSSVDALCTVLERELKIKR